MAAMARIATMRSPEPRCSHSECSPIASSTGSDPSSHRWLRHGLSAWPAAKARLVLAAPLRIGWAESTVRPGRTAWLAREGWSDFVFAFHDAGEIGPRMPARVARRMGLRLEDL